MKVRRGTTPSPAVGVTGTVLVHGGAVLAIIAMSAGARTVLPPTYAVHLVAAPEPDQSQKPAPEAVDRPAEEQPAPALKTKPTPRNTASKEAPPPTPDTHPKEAAPRTSSKTAPLPGEKPSTGKDLATVSTEGVEFPFPEYLNNLQSEILRRWHKPEGMALQAEVSFFIHRDGSVSGIQFVRRSGNFEFDLEAEGAVEEAARSLAFGPLPDGWKDNVLFVRFFFAPSQQ